MSAIIQNVQRKEDNIVELKDLEERINELEKN
jgi:hypothetical protein